MPRPILESDEYVAAEAIAKAPAPFESDWAAFKAVRGRLETVHGTAKTSEPICLRSRTPAPELNITREQGDTGNTP